MQKRATKQLDEERAKVASQAEVQIGPKVERARAIEVRWWSAWFRWGATELTVPD